MQPFRICALAILFSASASQCQVTVADEEQQEATAVRAYGRYLQLLRRSPKEGVSLDRVYGFHVDRGSLDEFVLSLRQQSVEPDANGSAAMLLGLIESRRGQDAAARASFEIAEAKRANDPMVSWYLGQSLQAIGETQLAAEAMERALKKDVPRAMQEKVFLKLGRIYQRTQQTEKAIDLWKRFESAFPNDDRVQEQIASILIDENQLEEALARYESLIGTADEPYRRVQFGVKAAGLKLKLGKQQEGLTDYESLLEDLKPSSWLFNDVRSRIEESFVRTDDYSGLVVYYEKWMEDHSDDLDAMTRLGRYLAILGRSDAAEEWYQKAIAKAPSDSRIRLALIEQLIGDGKYADAIVEYEALATIDPRNPDNIERWGMLYLRHPDLNTKQRREKAAEVWKRLLSEDEDDAIIISRLADLFRSASMVDESIAYYKRAIELEPNDLQYREYLGEYFHILNRPDEARQVWQAMVEGDQRTTQNLARLSEVYKSFGYAEEALESLEAACELDPEFSDRIRLSTMLRDARRFDDSLVQLAKVEKLVASPEEQQIILQERIKTLLDAGQLASETLALERQVSDSSTAEEWRVVATYQEALNRLPDACRSAARAVKLEPQSIPALALSARVLEKSGALADASAANRNLARLDTRFRSEYLKKIAELERRLGRTDQALKAGKDLITAAPGNPESYRFYSDLCFQLGRTELGLDALRRSVRVNPSDVESLTQLAQALADQFETAEAIELYWRAFQKAEKLDDQIQLVQTLAELYLRTSSFDRLISRLENQSKDLSQQRDMVICLANAHQTAGDVGRAREVLTGLLNQNSQDVILLDELTFLAEQANELEEAIGYQKQIVKLAGSADAKARLANLYLRADDPDSAKLVWDQISAADGSASRILKSIDKLIVGGDLDTAADLCDQLLTSNAEDWESLLRLAIVRSKHGQTDEAEELCDRILSIKLPASSPSMLARSGRRGNSNSAVGGSLNQSADVPPLFARSDIISGLLTNLGLRPVSRQQTQGAVWAVTDFGQCRAAAVCIRVGLAAQSKSLPAYIRQLEQQATATIGNDRTAAWDLWYAASTMAYVPSADSKFEPGLFLTKASLLLQRAPNPDSRMAFLESTLNRRYYQASGKLLVKPPEALPLNEQQLESVLANWEAVAATNPEWLNRFGGISSVITEYERAGKTDRAKELLSQLVREDATSEDLNAALNFAVIRNDLPKIFALRKRLAAMPQMPRSSRSNTVMGSVFSQYATQVAMTKDPDLLKDLITTFLNIKAMTFNPQVSVQSAARLPAQLSGGIRFPISGRGTTTSYQQVKVVPANKYFSASDQTFFVNLAQLYPGQRQDKLRSIFVDYNRQAKGEQKVFAELAIANIEFLRGNEEQSVIHQVRAAVLAPNDDSLRMNLVRYYQGKNNFMDALQLLDTIKAVDQDVLKNREMLAITLAAKTGNTDRAKLAAERLFGLRLDSRLSIWLSSQMQSLGMKEMSSALLSRTRKSAGNNLQILVSLLNQYSKEDNMDVASQIAHQILRNTRGMSVSRTNATSPVTARQAAVSLLSKTGQLDGLIQRSLDQLRRSPKSVQLHQTLIEYYKASGKSQEAAALSEKLKLLTPETVDTLLADANKLRSARKYSEACDKYLEAFHRDPKRIAAGYLTYSRTFVSAKRQGALIELLLKDKNFRKSPDGYQIVANAVQSAFQARQGATSIAQMRAVELFAAAWEEYPNYRSELIGRITYPSVWQNPEMLRYAQEGIIPKTIQQAIAKPWVGIADSITYSSDGRATGTFTRIAEMLNRDMKQRTAYTQEIEAAVERFDKWHGGKVMLALLKGSAGATDECFDLIDGLRSDPEVLYIPTNVSWVVGCELEQFQEDRFLNLAAQLLEGSMSKDTATRPTPSFSTTAGRRLAILYHRMGQTESARLAVREAFESMDYSVYGNISGYLEYTKIGNLNTAAEELLRIGCPFDALEYFEQINEQSVAAAGRYATSLKRTVETARAGKARAIAAITPENVIQYLQRDSKNLSARNSLLISPPATDSKDPRITSVLIERLISSNDEASDQQVATTLQKLLSSDSSTSPATATIAVVWAARTDNKTLLNLGFKSLERHLSSPPTQDAIEFDEVGLWIPARTAFGFEQYQEIGEHLAARATTAAEASSDDRWLISMMKERGELAIANGNRKLAEESWSRLLDAVLADSSDTSVELSTIKVESDDTRPIDSPAAGSALEELRKQLLTPSTNLAP